MGRLQNCRLFLRNFVSTALHPLRPPVVTIMGHVDHGKTTIIDYFRKSSIAASEAGGITQHIGAFSVTLPTSNSTINRITFLDTPGHAAFSKIRERGANVTDIVVLVVSADDGVMAQTIESINFAKSARVPIVVAINKCDKFFDRVPKVKEDLLRYDIVCEDYGGDTQAIAVSGLTGINMNDLLEALQLQGELLELRCDPSCPVEGTIIESKMKQGLGECATMIIQKGTLKTGSLLVAEDSFCKVRVLLDHSGNIIKEAPPSTPVEVAGWKSLPTVGSIVTQVNSEEEAKGLVDLFHNEKQLLERQKLNSIIKERAKLHDLMWQIKKQNSEDHKTPLKSVMKYEEVDSSKTDKRPTLTLIIKCDVVGSQEAIEKDLQSIKSEKVKIEVAHISVGPVTEGDIRTSKSINAKILSFNLKTPKPLAKLAKAENVDILEFNIIYRLHDYLVEELTSLLPMSYQEQTVGTASVLQVFFIDKQPIAGCQVGDGVIHKSNTNRYFAKIVRNDETIWRGKIDSMKQQKKDISSAGKGLECGIGFSNCNVNILPGDRIVCIENVPLKPSL